MPRDAGLVGDVERAGKEGGDIGHDVDGGIGGVAVMHHHDRHVALGDQPCHAAIALQAPDIVGDDGAAIQRPGGDGRFHAVDGDGDAKRDHLGKHGLQPPQLVLRRHRLRAAIGAGGFCADVDDVGAFGDHAAGLRQRAFRRDEGAAVGEGIRGDVEHAHHGRVRPCQQRRQVQAAGRRGRRS